MAVADIALGVNALDKSAAGVVNAVPVAPRADNGGTLEPTLFYLLFYFLPGFLFTAMKSFLYMYGVSCNHCRMSLVLHFGDVFGSGGF